MQLFNVIISAVMVGCALALYKPQAENKLVLTDIDGIQGIKAIDLKQNTDFTGDVKSMADIMGSVHNGGSSMHEWNVGASDNGAHAGDNQVSSSSSGSSSSFVANKDNKLTLSKFANVQNFVGTNPDGKVDGIATGSNGNGRVNGKVDSVKPWEADWTNDKGTAKTNGNTATAERTDSETIVVKGARGSGIAKHNQTGVAFGGSKIFDTKYSADTKEDSQGNAIVDVNQKLFGVVDKTISTKTDKENNAASIMVENDEEYAKVSMIRSSEGPCDEEKYDNKFSDSDDGFRIEKDSVKIEMQPTVDESGEVTYEWPSCFDISMVMTLPVGVSVENLAAQLEVDLPLRQKFTCEKAYNCGSYGCFYDDLCNPSANKGLEKTVAVNDVLSNSENNACSAQSGRRLPFKATVCPDDKTVAGGNARQSIKPNFNVLDQVFEDVEATMKLFETNKGFSCNVFSQMFNKPAQVGCRKASASYAVRFNGAFLFSARQLEENFWNKPKTAATKAPKTCNKPKYCAYFPHFSGCKC